MIQIHKEPGQRILELGGGSARHPSADVNCDVRSVEGVDFVADFNAPLPIQSDEWDGVLSIFCIEHLSYTRVPQFLKEIHRILKQGGKAVVVTANTEAQIKWVQTHQEGWDGKRLFEAASEKLFGSQDYDANAHKCFFSPLIVETLFKEAGFSKVEIRPYGERETDLAIVALKGPSVSQETLTQQGGQIPQGGSHQVSEGQETGGILPTEQLLTGATVPPERVVLRECPREELFDRHYFDGGRKVGGYKGGYWDFPFYHVVARKVLLRQPESVLDIGCGRGYVLKKLQDLGLRACGLEISRHAWMTRVCEGIMLYDLCSTPWPWKDKEFDLVFGDAILEHIPEEFIPAVASECRRVGHRCLFGVDFNAKIEDDHTRVTLRDRNWFQRFFPPSSRDGWNCEIFDKGELESGSLPADVLKGDGKLKLNIGAYTTMHHYGWTNLDILDVSQFAQNFGYKFQKCDVRGGLPFPTEGVDLINSCHMLEHLTYKEGLALLKECRRVLKPDGAMRVIVPDAELLSRWYTSAIAGTVHQKLQDCDHINEGCANSLTGAGKLWALLHEGHQACYDWETLEGTLKEAGFHARNVGFRQCYTHPYGGSQQILRECNEVQPMISLAVDTIPRTT